MGSIVKAWPNGMGFDIDWGHSGSAEVWRLLGNSFGVRTFGPNGEPRKCAIVNHCDKPLFDMSQVAMIAHHDGASIESVELHGLTGGERGRPCPIIDW